MKCEVTLQGAPSVVEVRMELEPVEKVLMMEDEERDVAEIVEVGGYEMPLEWQVVD